MNHELGQQMKEFEARKQADVQERKLKVMTSGGPTQDPEDVEALNKKFRDQQTLTKLVLEKQRDMDKEQADNRRNIEVAQEKQDADLIAAKHIESKLVKNQQRKEQLQHFRAVWDAQKELKQKNDIVENEF